MPTPTNIDAANATVITSLPYTITVSAADVQSAPGLTHDLWWVYTNSRYSMVSEFALGSPFGATYPPGHTFNVPIVQLWTGTPGSLTQYPPSTGGFTQGVPIQAPF